MMKKILAKISSYTPSFLKNYYVASFLLFLVWMTFFDSNNFISQYKMRQGLNDLNRQKKYYMDEIRHNQTLTYALTKNRIYLEKFAREKYLMKKKGEDIFLIIEETSTEKK